MIGRREFITLLGCRAAWPIAAEAQQPAMPVVGFVSGQSTEDSARFGAAFRKALNETGYIEGQNVMVEYHWLNGHYDRVPALMADLVRSRVAVIATPGFTAGALAAKAATTIIPIVFGVAEDPVKLGRLPEVSREQIAPEAADAAAIGDNPGPVIAGQLRAPRRWEHFLVEAAVIGGRERWRRRIDGLANDLRLKLAELADEDEARAAIVARTLEDLNAFAGYALPSRSSTVCRPRHTGVNGLIN